MSMSSAEMLQMLEKAVNAPSGDNAQPWRFRCKNDSIEIWNVENADPTPYNFRERGSILALGAVAENIRILSTHFGYAAGIRAYPDGPSGCVARISLSVPADKPDQLASYIAMRSTNRSPYATSALTLSQIRSMDEAARDIGVTLRLAGARNDLNTLAHAVSMNERLLMEHRGLHDGLFRMIRFTRSAERRRPGMYIRTMDLPIPVEILFRTVLRSWTLLRLMNAVGFSRSIPAQTAPVYSSSSAFGALIMAGEKDADFFAVGRAMQRIWLTATGIGLALQPTAAILYLEQRLRSGDTQTFSSEHMSIISDAYSTIARTFHLTGNESIGMMFRIGTPTRKTVPSFKHKPIILS
jgi:sulfur-carrier protein adenylyltransferase/sulfurtransferase